MARHATHSSKPRSAHPASVRSPSSASAPTLTPSGIDSSPTVAAQRVRLRRLFGEAANLGPSPDGRADTPHTTGLPEPLRAGVESLSGHSLRDVRVHHNSDAPARVDAVAYAAGRDIHVAPGQEQHLPHEAWHVVQQRQGRVRATHRSAAGVPINEDAGLETEASTMGARALAATPASALSATPAATGSTGASPIQRVKGKNRGRRQKKKLAELAGQGMVRETLPGRAERRRQGQEADLREAVATLERRIGYIAHEKRVAAADTRRKTQESRHETQRSTRAARQERRATEAAEAQSEQDAMTRRMAKSRTETEERAIQAEVAAALQSAQSAADRKRTPAPVGPPTGRLAPADQFEADFPAAVHFRPLDGIKAVLSQHPNGSEFEDHQNFISSTFKTPSASLPRFSGQTVYHDTQGGSGGGFTIFGVMIGDDRFLVAHGHHKGAGYQIDWSCVPGDPVWGTGQDVGYGTT